MAVAALVAALTALALLAGGALGGWGANDPPFFGPEVTNAALNKFYADTGGPTRWPPAYRPAWANNPPCAWDGNWRAHPSPAGTRCYVGGWHRLPPAADGGLQFLMHVSGEAAGPVPAEFKAFQMTDWIIIAGNRLTGPLWNTSWHQFLHRLDVSRNQLEGPLGDRFMERNVHHAEIVNLAHNRFSGPLPPTLVTLKPLTAFIANDNELSGPLPDLSAAQHLRHLNVANNRLTGGLDWVARAPALNWLEVENNRLAGPLPPALPPGLSRFTLGGNQLSGEIPAAYGEHGHLRHFNCTGDGCDALRCPPGRPDLLAHLPFSTHCKPAGSRKW